MELAFESPGSLGFMVKFLIALNVVLIRHMN